MTFRTTFRISCVCLGNYCFFMHIQYNIITILKTKQDNRLGILYFSLTLWNQVVSICAEVHFDEQLEFWPGNCHFYSKRAQGHGIEDQGSKG